MGSTQGFVLSSIWLSEVAHNRGGDGAQTAFGVFEAFEPSLPAPATPVGPPKSGCLPSLGVTTQSSWPKVNGQWLTPRWSNRAWHEPHRRELRHARTTQTSRCTIYNLIDRWSRENDIRVSPGLSAPDAKPRTDRPTLGHRSPSLALSRPQKTCHTTNICLHTKFPATTQFRCKY